MLFWVVFSIRAICLFSGISSYSATCSFVTWSSLVGASNATPDEEAVGGGSFAGACRAQRLFSPSLPQRIFARLRKKRGKKGHCRRKHVCTGLFSFLRSQLKASDNLALHRKTAFYRNWVKFQIIAYDCKRKFESI